MEIANEYTRGLEERNWESEEWRLDRPFGTQLPPAYMLGYCLESEHNEPPSSKCGLWLEQYLQETGELKSVSKFVLDLEKLPSECRMLMYGDLFPPLPEKGKYWVIEKKYLRLGHATEYDYRFCHVQGVVELFYRMSKCRNRFPEMNNIAERMVREMLEFLGRRMVLQLICNDSSENSERLYPELDVPAFRLAKFPVLTAHIHHITLDLAVKDPHYTMSGMSARESVRMVNAIALATTNLKKVALHLHISRKNIKRGIKYPNQEGWVVACRELASRLLSRNEENLKITLTELDENIPSKVLDTWIKYGRCTWDLSKYERTRGTPDWMRHVKALEQALTKLLREQ